MYAYLILVVVVVAFVFEAEVSCGVWINLKNVTDKL